MEKNRKINGVKSKIDYALFRESELTRDQISQMLLDDIRGCYVIITEVLNSPQCMNSLTDVYWERYLRIKKEAAPVPDPELFPNEPVGE